MIDFMGIYKTYKRLILTIIIITAILLPIVLVVNNIVDIAKKTKEYKYIGGTVENRNSISVSGKGIVYAKPDIAVIDLSVITEGKSIGAVQTENSNKMNAVIEFLKGFNIDENDIKTVRYNISPRYLYVEGKVPEISGYTISQSLEVKIKQLDSIGEILDQSVNNGINQISSLRFSVDDDNELKAEARELAIEDAKTKAKELSNALGVKLVKIIGFTETSDYDYPVYREMAMGGGGIPEIETGENEISVTVNLIYEIN